MFSSFPHLEDRWESQWDFCGSRCPGRHRDRRAAILKVVPELRVKEERKKAHLGGQKLDLDIILIREVR